MPSRESSAAGLTPASWELDDDQLGLREAARQFARERLEPLFGHPPAPSLWSETVRLAATLDLATMILPKEMGGMEINRHDLSLIIEQFAAGPLERATELTLSSPALMTLREYNALDQLSHRDVQHYLDGTMSIAVCIPDVDASGLWVLRQHPVSPAMLIRMDDKGPRLVLGTLPAREDSRGAEPVAVLGALTIERYTAPPAGETGMLVAPPGERQLGDLARQWLVDAAIYLSSLLSGAVQQSMNFALTYSVTRHAFRKPIIAHQLVAARLADMLVSAHTMHLFCRSVAAQDSQAQLAAVSQMAHHICTEAMDVAREFVQLCGGHGFVDGLPPAPRFQMMHWFAMLLMKVEAALRAFTAYA